MSDLKRKVTAGLVWSILGSWGGRLINMAIFVALARLVVPQSFGLVAMSAAFLAFIDLIAQQGLGDALVQRPEINDRIINTAFVVNVSLALMLVIGVWFAAPYFALYMKTEGLTPVLRAASLGVLINALSATQSALYRRNFKYKLLAQRTLTASSVGGFTGIAVALAGGNEWSLVVQALASSTTSLVLLWRAPMWKPRLEFDRSSFGYLLNYSSRILGVRLLDFALNQMTVLLIGAKMGAVVLGLYTVGSRTSQIMLQLFTGAVTNVALSGFSRLSHDRVRLQNAYYRVVRMSGGIAMPAFILVSALAPEISVVLFGKHWLMSGFVLQITALLGAIQCIQFYSSICFNAIGRPSLTLLINLVKVACVYISFVLTWQGGLLHVVLGLVAGQILASPLNFYLAYRFVGIDLLRLARLLAPFLISSLIAYAAVYFGREALFAGSEDYLLRFVVLSSVAGAAYLLALLILGRRALFELLSFITEIKSLKGSPNV